jgi:hypothetical protein
MYNRLCTTGLQPTQTLSQRLNSKTETVIIPAIAPSAPSAKEHDQERHDHASSLRKRLATRGKQTRERKNAQIASRALLIFKSFSFLQLNRAVLEHWLVQKTAFIGYNVEPFLPSILNHGTAPGTHGITLRHALILKPTCRHNGGSSHRQRPVISKLCHFRYTVEGDVWTRCYGFDWL